MVPWLFKVIIEYLLDWIELNVRELIWGTEAEFWASILWKQKTFHFTTETLWGHKTFMKCLLEIFLKSILAQYNFSSYSYKFDFHQVFVSFIHRSSFLSMWSLSILGHPTSGDCSVCILSLVHVCRLRYWNEFWMPANQKTKQWENVVSAWSTSVSLPLDPVGLPQAPPPTPARRMTSKKANLE